MRSTRVALAGLVSLVLVAGCGAGGGSRDLSAGRATVLQRDVAAMASAARAGDGTAVAAAYAQLRRDVTAGRADGSLSPTRAAQVLTAAAAVAADVPAPAPAPAPAPRPAASPTPAPVVKAPAPQPQRHKSKGKAKGEREKKDD